MAQYGTVYGKIGVHESDEEPSTAARRRSVITVLACGIVVALTFGVAATTSRSRLRQPQREILTLNELPGGLNGLPELTQPKVIHLGMDESMTMSFVPWQHSLPMPFQVKDRDTIMDVAVTGVAYMYCNGTLPANASCDTTRDADAVLAQGAFPGATIVLPVGSELKVRFQNLVKCKSASKSDAGGYHGFGGKCHTNIHFHGAFTGGGVWPDGQTLMDMVTMEVAYREYVDYRIVYPSTKLGPEAPGSRHQIIHPHFDPMTALQMGGGALSNLLIDETHMVNQMLAALTGDNIPRVTGLSNDDPSHINRRAAQDLGHTIQRVMAVSKLDLAQLKKIGQISGGCSVNDTIAHRGASGPPLTFNETILDSSDTTGRVKEIECGWYNWACHDALNGDKGCGNATPKYAEPHPHPDIFEPLYGDGSFPYVVTLNGFARVTKLAMTAGKWELWYFANMGWATGTLNMRFECAYLADNEGFVPTRGPVQCDSPSGQCQVKCRETCHMRLWSKDGISIRDPFRNISRVPLPASGRAAVLVMCTRDPHFSLKQDEVAGQTYLYARDFTQHMYPDLWLYAFRTPLSRVELVGDLSDQGWNLWEADGLRAKKKLQAFGSPPQYLGALENESVADNCTLPHSYLGGNVYATRTVDAPLWSQEQWNQKKFLANHTCVNPSLSVPMHPSIDTTNPTLAPSIKKLADRFNAQDTSRCLRFNPFQYIHRAACGELVDDIISMISAHPHHMHLHHFQLQEFYDGTYESVNMDSVQVKTWIEASSAEQNGVTDYQDLGQKEYYKIGDYHHTFLPHGVPNARLRHLLDCKNLSPLGIMTSVINHCHILSHEDTGMMYQLGVTPEGTGCSWDLPVFDGNWSHFSKQMTGSPVADPAWKAALERVFGVKAKPLL